MPAYDVINRGTEEGLMFARDARYLLKKGAKNIEIKRHCLFLEIVA